MRACAIGFSMAVCLCVVLGCSTGPDQIKTSGDARYQAQILKARAVGKERQIEIDKKKMEKMAERIDGFKEQQAKYEAELKTLPPKIDDVEKKLQDATSAQRGYLVPALNELTDRKLFLETKIGENKQNVAFYEEQKTQFENNIDAMADEAEDLHEQARKLDERAAEMDKKAEMERKKAEAEKAKAEKADAEKSKAEQPEETEAPADPPRS